MKRIPYSVKKSIQYSFSIIAGVSTIVGIWGYTIKDINDKWSWWMCAIILLSAFILLAGIIGIIIHCNKHKKYSTEINGKPVTIAVGDIFAASGLKIIPFNEYFDIIVDDIVIAHNTLNGKLIDYYVDDIHELEKAIQSAKSDNSPYKYFTNNNGKVCYPLGRIIPYQDYLLLSFSHFDIDNHAYIGIGEYEQLLFRMWREIRRVYAAKPIVLPLLGAGITTFSGDQGKDYTSLIKCILCTLKNSGFQPDQGIKIILTKDTIKKVDINTIREEF